MIRAFFISMNCFDDLESEAASFSPYSKVICRNNTAVLIVQTPNAVAMCSALFQANILVFFNQSESIPQNPQKTFRSLYSSNSFVKTLIL